MSARATATTGRTGSRRSRLRLPRCRSATAIIDGEAAILDESGISHLGLLQEVLGRGSCDKAAVSAPLAAFDLLFPDGHDLRGRARDKRRDALVTILPATHDWIRLNEAIEGDGAAIMRGRPWPARTNPIKSGLRSVRRTG
ncbi:hypothetical protein [Chelatococcus reniformis]|uniref:ATP-dependent DNA ligase family profile domain-containing protein n=1 Tax=Chelatococcus reniformis TaxID=1494448 RepID=A0A916U0S2_9HYPH|nr:hypothetical protein [Chelatococcus reniformis]GGC55213.1 hypothetical protein GCM10010994_12650 [Chelatococcus reniformis]